MRPFFSPGYVIMKHQPEDKLLKGMTGRNTLWIPGKMQKVLMTNDIRKVKSNDKCIRKVTF